MFEKDKLVFSFMLCAEIMKAAGDINLDEWNFFLRGAGMVEKDRPTKPTQSWMTLNKWFTALDIGDILPTFRGMARDIVSTPCWVEIGGIIVRANPENDPEYGPEPPVPDPPKPPGESTEQKQTEDDGKVKGHWDIRLQPFQKLVFIKAFQEESVVMAVTEFVRQNMGQVSFYVLKF